MHYIVHRFHTALPRDNSLTFVSLTAVETLVLWLPLEEFMSVL